MSIDNINSGIDKYSGSFSQDDLGVTQIPTATIKLLNNFTHLGLFTFLASCPAGWKLNAKHLAAHFDCGKDKIYNAIDSLIELKLLSRTEIRDQGRFKSCHYRLHLRQLESANIEQSSPCPEKPDTVNPDAYKTSIDLPIPKLNTNNTHCGVSVVKKLNTGIKVSDMLKDNPHKISEAYLTEWKAERIKPLTARVWTKTNQVLTELIAKGLPAQRAFEIMLQKAWADVEVHYFDKHLANGLTNNAPKPKDFPKREPYVRPILSQETENLINEGFKRMGVKRTIIKNTETRS